MTTHELLQEATRRQIEAMTGEQARYGRTRVVKGRAEIAHYLATMGIEDGRDYTEWLHKQVTNIIGAEGGGVSMLYNPVGVVASAMTAGMSVGYQLALIREEEASE